ncbi:MAG: Transglycosylase domain [Acidimicrobiales bacterium]|nr:Transglycosylase domain [Acidimicrobiales bacterium]
MRSPQNTAAIEDLTVPTTTVRRRRSSLRVLLPLLALVTVAFATTACSPEATARDAIEKYWGPYTACAERIVDRESNFQSGAVNRSSGTTGLFQIHPTHASWIKQTYGYEFSEMKDPYKNSRVAKGLSDQAYRYWRDGWQPWRIRGGAQRGGACPA